MLDLLLEELLLEFDKGDEDLLAFTFRERLRDLSLSPFLASSIPAAVSFPCFPLPFLPSLLEFLFQHSEGK